LFEQRPWILTTPASVSESQLTQLRTLIDGVGARVHEMSAEDHDRVVSYLSHLPQLTVTALMHVVGHHVGVEGLALAGRGLRDTTRLASSPVQMWRDVSATNAANIGAALDDLIVALQVVRAQLSEPGPEFERLFASANQWKAALDGS
jgi:prephenate dehydrogenase